ncbi:MAG: hypothetical protein M1493_13520, partial [Firmicutes bacterium]|nr:hypothetical protein [Bacillota bacterium]
NGLGAAIKEPGSCGGDPETPTSTPSGLGGGRVHVSRYPPREWTTGNKECWQHLLPHFKTDWLSADTIFHNVHSS